MKINLRESLNKIDLATDNKYDLLNTFDSKKLSDNSKKKLAEAIENNSMASVNRILHESEEQLYKVVISSGATKRNFESALYEDEAEEIVDYYGGRWIDENGFEWNMYVEEDDNSTEHAMIDNSYDMEDDDERAQREMDAYDQSDRDWEYVESFKDKDVLEYDDEMSDELIDMFDIASPQDVADSFKKDVKSKNKIYKPINNENLKESYEDFFEIETNLRSNSKIKMSSGSWKVDTIYLMYDSEIDNAPHLIGYAHDDDGNYDHDALTADEIVNCDLSNYMDGVDVIDVEGMIKDNPKYFYTKFNDGPIKFDESAKRFSKSLKEASYGGAYDIEDDMFFTKEDIVEFADNICEDLAKEFGYKYDIVDVYMDSPTKLHIELIDNHDVEVDINVRIDMRKIKKPNDLEKVYHNSTLESFKDRFLEEYQYYNFDESLKENKLSGYNILSSTLKDGGDTYALLRKVEDDKVKWAAAKYVNGIPDEDNIFEITYEQARGFEPLTDTGKMSRKLGKVLLPKKENLKEDLSDLDLILNTPADTKQFNEETFRALKNLVSEYKKDLDSLDQWALESEKEPFVKKWYKLADKCKEIAKNGIRGITGYGRLNDFIKFKVVDLARSVDNTFPWYTRNNLAKFNKLESLKEAVDDEIDLNYETDFDDDGVEEGNVFVEGGVEYAWIQREAGPLYLDFDKWAVWSAREYVDPRDFITIHDDGKGYDFDEDTFKEKAMTAPITYFVVDEDTGFIDWGPEDNEIAAKDFLNGKKEDWENDMDESLNEDKKLEEYYTVNLHYEDIGDGREYDYEADYDDVLEYLMEICTDDDNAPEDTEEYLKWVEDNFDELFNKYEYEIEEHFREDASQEEYNRRHSSYEPEYDTMD